MRLGVLSRKRTRRVWPGRGRRCKGRLKDPLRIRQLHMAIQTRLTVLSICGVRGSALIGRKEIFLHGLLKKKVPLAPAAMRALLTSYLQRRLIRYRYTFSNPTRDIQIDIWAIVLIGNESMLRPCIQTSLVGRTNVNATVFGTVHFVTICAGARFSRRVEFSVAGAATTREATRERVTKKDESIVRTPRRKDDRTRESREGERMGAQHNWTCNLFFF